MTDQGLGSAAPCCGRSGFTIVEIMMACVIVGGALLGIYSVFKQAMDAEAAAAVSWNDREAAVAVVNHLAEALERSVSLSGAPALIGGPEGGRGRYALQCLVTGDGRSQAAKSGRGMQWRKYTWGAVSPDSRENILELRTLCLAGTKRIAPFTSLDEFGAEEVWKHLEPAVIGRRMRKLTVLYRPSDAPGSDWKDQWRGQVDNVSVRIRLEVGAQTVQRVVVPRVNAALLDCRES